MLSKSQMQIFTFVPNSNIKDQKEIWELGAVNVQWQNYSILFIVLFSIFYIKCVT